MNDKPMPYALRLALAVANNDQDAANAIVRECVGDMIKALLETAHQYHSEDQPFMAAAMQITSQALRMMMSEGAKNLMDKIVNQSECVVIDVDEMKKQVRGDAKDGEA